ncbi:MAG: hypothetical protein ACP5O7_09410 [Phycisphaerae bacterium]
MRFQPSHLKAQWRASGLSLWVGIVAAAFAAIPWLAQRSTTAATPQAMQKPAMPVAIFGVVTLSSDDPMPVPGVHVQVFSAGMPQRAILPPVKTNAAGLFTFDAQLSPGRYIVKASKGLVARRVPLAITSRSRWYRLVNIQMARPAPGQNVHAATSRWASVAVFGQVTKPDGVSPLPGALVIALRPAGSGPWELSGRVVTTVIASRKFGLFDLKDRLSHGRYQILATLRSADETVASVPLTIAGSPLPAVVLRIKAGAGLVTGRVLGPDGKPVAKASVELVGGTHANHLLDLSTDTGADGRYTLRYVPLGTYIGGAYPPAGSPMPPSGHYPVMVGRRPVQKDFRLGRASP